MGTSLRFLLLLGVLVGCGARTILRDPVDHPADASTDDLPVTPDVPPTPDVPRTCADFQTLCSGRCVDTLNDNFNCGACGAVCGDSACSNGACRMTPCVPPTSLCGVRCIDLRADPDNCGGCGNRCAPGTVCEASVCVEVCSGVRVRCGVSCVDLNSDASNCGACGRACGLGGVCLSGRCQSLCAPPAMSCFGACVDPRSDPAHCGVCGRSCAAVGLSCVNGECQSACRAGQILCGAECVDPLVDSQNCGGCGRECSAGTMCTGGTCRVSPPPTGAPFRIDALDGSGCRVVSHEPATGDDRGGIAISARRVFYTGDRRTAAFDLLTLTATPTDRVDDGLVSDLSTGQVYSLRSDGAPIGDTTVVINQIALVDAVSGALLPRNIPLSRPIPVRRSTPTGIFSGYGRFVLYANRRAYDVNPSTGVVAEIGPLPFDLTFNTCETWAFWGVAEFFGGAIHLAYVRDPQTIVRTRIPDGTTSVIANYMSLSDMCSFTVSPALSRWYWHHEGGSQLASGDESLGYCGARFSLMIP